MWMGALVLGLAPLAEPAGVVAFAAPGETAAAVEAAIVAKGFKARNVSVEHAAFDTLSPLRLGNLDAAAPTFWPKALQKDWDEGIATCKAAAGGPPYNPSNRVAFLCGGDAAVALWQRYLDHLNPARVLIVSAADADKGVAVNVAASLFAPGETALKSDEKKVTKADAAKTAGLITNGLLGAEGKAGTREVVRAFPRVVGGDDAWLKAGTAAAPVAIPFPATCTKAVPETLALTPADAAISQGAAALWKASVVGHEDKGKTLTCSLKVFVTATGIMNVPGLHAQIPLLNCGGAQLAGKSTPGISMAPASVQSSMAKQIVTAALDAACK